MLGEIDCFVPMPQNFRGQNFCNTYVGGVGDSVATLVF
jgi:hypothetical protein